MIGYYLAAAVVDNRYIGRLRLQLLGFFMVAVLFYVSAIWYHPLTSKGGIHTFQFVSLISPFSPSLCLSSVLPSDSSLMVSSLASHLAVLVDSFKTTLIGISATELGFDQSAESE